MQYRSYEYEHGKDELENREKWRRLLRKARI
jgi:hypothetical protein